MSRLHAPDRVSQAGARRTAWHHHVLRRVVRALLITPACVVLLGAWCTDDSDRRSIMARAETGQLDAAERAARSGGAPMLTTLGDVLTMRGQLAAADSAYSQALSARAPLYRVADVGQAELQARRGDLDEALTRAVDLTRDYQSNGSSWTAEEHVAAGRAYVLLGLRDARLARQALGAFDAAWAADPTLYESRTRAGELLLDKYNAPDATSSFADVLKADDDNARALLGMARVQDFSGDGKAMATVRQSLEANPSLTAAHTMLARLYLEAEAYDSAMVETDRALAIDSTDLDTWATRASVAWITGDSATFEQAQRSARALHPRPADFYAIMAASAVRHRRYDDGVRWAQQAVTLDSLSVRALGVLGTNQLRTGDMKTGRATLERAFAIDPFNLWHKNTLDLLDQMDGFTVVDRGRFQLVVSPEDATLMELYLLPMLEEAYDSLQSRYLWKPDRQVRFEIFREHADFSVRSVGLAGLGALGVSFGDVLAMDAPSAREAGTFNWGSTAWHELAHTFTLGSTRNRVPRWVSEGLSVLEERRARDGWGAQASLEFLAAYKADKLRPVSALNDGFVRPRYPAEVQFSYYLASLVCEMIEEQYGAARFPQLMSAWRDGLESPQVFERVLGVTGDSLDAQFRAYMDARFGRALAFIEPGDGPGDVRGPYVNAMREGLAHLEGKRSREATAAFEKALAMMPEVNTAGGPAWQLARLALERADTTTALTQLARVTRSSETALAANALEADLHEARGNDSVLAQTLERMIWMAPYDISTHTRLADAATRAGLLQIAVRERRAVLAIGPSDPLEARYQLALSLLDAGDAVAARREVLGMLETAPGFEKAQSLLLQVRSYKTPPEARQ